MVTLANYWSAKGYQITLLTMAEMGSDFYDLDPRITRLALEMATESRSLIQGAANNIRRAGSLYRVLRTVKPDIAIAMMPSANVTLAIAGQIAGVPTIGSERVYPSAMPLGRLWEIARRRCYPLLSGLVVQTDCNATWLSSYAAADKISVISNPVQYPLPRLKNRLKPEIFRNRLNGRKILLAAGRLTYQKGFDKLILSFASVSSKYPEWSLVILGEGEDRHKLMAQASSLGVERNMAFPGVVGNVGDWFAAADAYIMTSRFEGFPNTLLEAMAYGLPVLAVDCKTGPSDVIVPDVNGLLVDQDDPQALIAGIERLIGDADLRKKIAVEATKVREVYSVEKIAKQWEKIFNNIISNKVNDVQ